MVYVCVPPLRSIKTVYWGVFDSLYINITGKWEEKGHRKVVNLGRQLKLV